MPRHLTATAALLGAATAINLKRLLKADDGAIGGQNGNPAARNATILALVALLAATLSEMHALLAVESSTGS